MQKFADFSQFNQFHKSKSTPSLTDLQKFYYKKHKKQSQLSQITNHNKIYLPNNNPQSKNEPQPQTNKNPYIFQTRSLLNQQQISFKTIQKIIIDFSCVMHAIMIILLILANEWNILVTVCGICLQVLGIVINILHFKENIIFCWIKNRTRFIKFQIFCIVLAILISTLLLYGTYYEYFMIVTIVIDGILIKKLTNLYKTQKIMDTKFPQYQLQIQTHQTIQKSDAIVQQIQ